jgi:hypothetical protein
VRLEGLGQLKNPITSIGNGTPDLLSIGEKFMQSFGGVTLTEDLGLAGRII